MNAPPQACAASTPTPTPYAPVDRLDGRVAVIVGGAGAIGAQTARRLAALGARVALVHRGPGPAKADAVLAMLPAVAAGPHAAFIAEVTDSASLTRAAAEVAAQMGPAAILVNSAGFTQAVPVADLDGLTDELIDRIFQVNWRGAFATVRAFAPQMRAVPDAVVVNVSSIAAFTGQGSNLAYAAAKAGTDLMTKALAKALAPQLRVVGVSPGVVNTGFVPGRGADFNAKAAAATPLRRVGEADDVARAIVALVTTMSFANGTTVVVDGGRHLTL